MIKRITLSRQRMLASDPCWLVDGTYMDGFKCWGVVFVRARDGVAWMEFHGDAENFHEADEPFERVSGPPDRVLFNLLPREQIARLKTNPQLHIGAVNRGNVQRGLAACTIYNADGGALVPAYRFDGLVRSVVMRPLVLTRPEPLNAWIEVVTDGQRSRVEILP